MEGQTTRLTEVFIGAEQALGDSWLDSILVSPLLRHRLAEADANRLVREFLGLARDAARANVLTLEQPAAAPLREFLERFSRERAAEGFQSDQTATFVFSLKRALFKCLRDALGGSPDLLADGIWAASEIVDQWGLYTMSVFQRSREDIIRRQQEELLELSTPVVKLWDGVIALPMIGTLDSARTQVVMETLLQRIVDTDAQTAIIDITGVPVVDTLVAQHLMKTVAAIRLMGADCIVSGIRPQIAQTIVHLGLDLSSISTRSTLADALRLAMQRMGCVISAGAAAS